MNLFSVVISRPKVKTKTDLFVGRVMVVVVDADVVFGGDVVELIFSYFKQGCIFWPYCYSHLRLIFFHT